ncbi:thiolase domain-containing protein [Vulcanisaeta distributa]|uniref:Acetyl-CoA acetyltransferase n=1 Tax=Vulcanisaeta distributa (strain DSM 14429 / JCM 11212 / NBRC 100878 / IC-017) TaxID=572478 RepID=E1QNX3_VULDI|nr:thiolase domain-containing protein [Vulcanisaeta distributa]ADN51338.1 acetyl-CoA acetyltransferase [Vulcanisaeta distributa DSM 14429]
MRKVGIIGVGQSVFGVRNDVTIQELAWEAVKEALDDAGLTQRDIEISIVGSAGTRTYELYPAVPINEYSGLSEKGPIRVEAACATGSAALAVAYNMVASGFVDVALAIGVEKMNEVDTATSLAVGGRGGNYLWEYHFYGTTFPAYYALYATAHMAKFGTTEEQLALVRVKNQKYAARNPKAQFQFEVTVEDVLKSRPVAWPLKLYDCSAITDGAAAAIVASEDAIRKLRIDTPVWIEAIGYASDTSNITRREDYVSLRATRLAAQMAYRKAGIEPRDVEVAEVHDCFTIAEIMAYEDLGFTEKGEGGKFIEEGQSEIGGKVAVNLSGGLLGKGHPLGATGLAMIYELVKQLREERERGRQAPLKRYIALAHNIGGTGHYGYVTILRR